MLFLCPVLSGHHPAHPIRQWGLWRLGWDLFLECSESTSWLFTSCLFWSPLSPLRVETFRHDPSSPWCLSTLFPSTLQPWVVTAPLFLVSRSLHMLALPLTLCFQASFNVSSFEPLLLNSGSCKDLVLEYFSPQGKRVFSRQRPSQNHCLYPKSSLVTQSIR